MQAGKPTVLILEDEACIRELIRRTLELHDFEVLEAGTALQAREALQSLADRIDLLICDVALPDEPGPSVVEHVRRTCPKIKILMISGFFDPDLAPPTLAVLSKPFRQADLLRKIREILAAA